jgi:hypothetical protein
MGVPGSANLLLLGGEQGYKIERSLRFNSADSAYLNRTPASAGNTQKFTLSAWVKIASPGDGYREITLLGAGTGAQSNTANDNLQLRGNGTGLQIGLLGQGGSGGTYAQFSPYHRDPSSWQHIVVAVDTTQATQANRVRAYFNGVEETAYVANGFGLNYNFSYLNTTATHVIGRCNETGGPIHTDAYITELFFIDGQQLTPSSFGETDTITGVWKPKKYAGTYGTNGFYLNFSDNSGTTSTTLGKDSSGNGNNWTPNNFSVTAGAGNDSMIDVPTPYADGGNGRGNYCTLNPLISNAPGYLIPAINGNLEVSVAAGSNAFFGQAGTQAITSGKFYWEVTPTAIATSAGTWMEVGIIQSALTFPDGAAIGAYNGGFAYTNDGYKARTATYSSYGATWTTNDVIGIALDATGGSITFYKNGVSQGAAYTDLTNYNLPAGYYPAIAIYRNTGITQSAVFNFGQRPFAYTPPSGFVALNTQNLPEPSIKKPGTYFDAKLYTGNNGTLTVTGLGFSPDLVWIKNRETAGTSHVLQDQVRGTTAYLQSNSTAAENTNTANDWFRAFTSDGFTVAATTTGGTATGEWNNNGSGYVAWCWDESATPGFDIVTYTGNGTARTIAHSLGVAPSMMIVKRRDSGVGATNWFVYHSRLNNGVNPAQYYLLLQSTNGTGGLSSVWNDTAPTSSVFSVGTSSETNGSGGTFVAYLWSEVAGFSKFGSYTGNGSSDGPFVFCGFRPRWVLIKSSTVATSWYLFDAVRGTINVNSTTLYPNTADIEDTNFGQGLDFLSNGFKVRAPTGYGLNNSSATYIFAAFAEAPFKYSLAR